MPIAELSIVDEVESAISASSAEKRLETIKRVTDLFLSSAGKLNDDQIELFDNVLERLIKTIELRAIADISAGIALAEMSAQLAPVAQAPTSVMQRKALEAAAVAASFAIRDDSPIQINVPQWWGRSRKAVVVAGALERFLEMNGKVDRLG